MTTITLSLSVIAVLLSVLVHHEAMRWLSRERWPRAIRSHRRFVSLTVLILMLAHLIEVMIYSVTMYIGVTYAALGYLAGEDISLSTYIYFSFSCYTSLGIGDIVPMGHGLRLIAGIEALHGLLMIGWSASFLLVEMRER